MQGWKDELLKRHLIEGVQTPVIKGDPPMKGKDTSQEGVWAMIGAPDSDCRMTTSGDTEEKVCGPRYEPSSERPRANVMARYEWTCV